MAKSKVEIRTKVQLLVPQPKPTAMTQKYKPYPGCL